MEQDNPGVVAAAEQPPAPAAGTATVPGLQALYKGPSASVKDADPGCYTPR